MKCSIRGCTHDTFGCGEGPENLYEILVPTIYGDTMKPIRTKHHKRWDERVKKVAGGLTIMHPAKGYWVHQGEDFTERVIPVRIQCTTDQIYQIAAITAQHYRQKAVMFYRISSDSHILSAEELAKYLP